MSNTTVVLASMPLAVLLACTAAVLAARPTAGQKAMVTLVGRVHRQLSLLSGQRHRQAFGQDPWLQADYVGGYPTENG